MRFPWMGLSPLALLALFSIACSSGQKAQPQSQAPTASARPMLQQQPQPANSQQIQAMQAELAAREARIRELEAQKAQAPANKDAADPQIAGVASTYDKAKRELTVTLQ